MIFFVGELSIVTVNGNVLDIILATSPLKLYNSFACPYM
jgi:hypothetical protein